MLFLDRVRWALPTDLELLQRVIKANPASSIDEIKQAIRDVKPDVSDERIKQACKQELGAEAPDDVDACLEQLKKIDFAPSRGLRLGKCKQDGQ